MRAFSFIQSGIKVRQPLNSFKMAAHIDSVLSGTCSIYKNYFIMISNILSAILDPPYWDQLSYFKWNDGHMIHDFDVKFCEKVNGENRTSISLVVFKIWPRKGCSF